MLHRHDSLDTYKFHPIPGYEGLYECNELGIVRSLDRVVIHKNGKQQPVAGRVMSAYADSVGYMHVTLCKDGKQKAMGVHRIVALTFIPNPENKSQVNHIDGDKSNNHVDNLEWVTAAENNEHAWQNSLNCNAPRAVVAIDKLSGDVKTFPSVLAAKAALSYDVYSYLERHEDSPTHILKYADHNLDKKMSRISASKQPVGGNVPMPVRCIDTGEEFPSVRKCGQHFNIDDEVIRRALRYSSGYVKKYHLRFEFI